MRLVKYVMKELEWRSPGTLEQRELALHLV